MLSVAKKDDGNITDVERPEEMNTKAESVREEEKSQEKEQKELSEVKDTKDTSDMSKDRLEHSEEKTPEEESKKETKEEESKEKEESQKEEVSTPSNSKEPKDNEKAEDAPTPSEKGDTFVPPILKTLSENSNKEIFEERDKGSIVAEGWIWKKRRIFSCFWHQKYFVLTKDGVLKYYKADGRRKAKGNWNIKEADDLREYNLPSEENKHPCRVMVVFPDSSLLLAFDERNTKDYWVERLNEIIKKSKK
ncbi:putative PH domain-containing protein [Encephalitozoon intestinalis]